MPTGDLVPCSWALLPGRLAFGPRGQDAWAAPGAMLFLLGRVTGCPMVGRLPPSSSSPAFFLFSFHIFSALFRPSFTCCSARQVCFRCLTATRRRLRLAVCSAWTAGSRGREPGSHVTSLLSIITPTFLENCKQRFSNMCRDPPGRVELSMAHSWMVLEVSSSKWTSSSGASVELTCLAV